LLVPPMGYREMIAAIDRKKVFKDQGDVQVTEGDDYWKGDNALMSESCTANGWGVAIAEGGEVDLNRAMEISDKASDDRLDAIQIIDLWMEKYGEQGLDVIDDARTYLTLLMKYLAKKKPMEKPFTGVNVLNGGHNRDPEKIAYAEWDRSLTYLSSHNSLCLRTSKHYRHDSDFEHQPACIISLIPMSILMMPWKHKGKKKGWFRK
jgi:hypothetical protein